MTSTRKLRTGILSDASILSECPTAFAQGGGRTYGLVTIAGAPNEMAQRPKRADGLINTLSRKSGESTDALTQMYRNGINNTPLNPIVVMPMPIPPVPYMPIPVPIPMASRPVSRGATPAEARLMTSPASSSELEGDEDLEGITDEPISGDRRDASARAMEYGIEQRMRPSMEGSSSITSSRLMPPIASPVMSLNQMGKQPIRTPNVNAPLTAEWDFLFRTPTGVVRRVTRSQSKKTKTDRTAGMVAEGEIDAEVDEIDRNMLLAQSIVGGTLIEREVNPPRMMGRARDRRQSEGPRVQAVTELNVLPDRNIRGLGMVQQPFAEAGLYQPSGRISGIGEVIQPLSQVTPPANIPIADGTLIASTQMREGTRVYTQQRATTPRMKTDAMTPKEFPLVERADVSTFQAIAPSAPSFGFA